MSSIRNDAADTTIITTTTTTTTTTFATWRRHARQNRWIVYFYCFGTVSCAAGVVYGWPALRQALQDDDDDDWSSETALGAAFTAGAWSTQGVRFVTGYWRDRYGTAVITAACLTAVAVGSIGVAICQTPLTLGMALFCQGIGAGVQLCVQPVVATCCFPQHAGVTLASLSGAFQISGLVYLALTRMFATRTSGFLFHAVGLMGLAALAVWLLPAGLPPQARTTTNTAVDDDKNHNQKDTAIHPQMANATTATGVDSTIDVELSDVVTKTLDATTSSSTTATTAVTTRPTTTTINHGQHVQQEQTAVAENKKQQEETSVDAEIDGATTTSTVKQSAWNHIWSWKFLGLVQWFSLVITPLQYYLGSVGFQLEDMGDTTGKYSDLFSILYGCASILSPAGGYLADRYTLGLAHALATALSAASFFCLAANEHISLKWQSIGLACNATGRMWVFGTFFAHVGHVFGYQHFGTLAGLGLLISAVVSLLQYPLLAAAAHGHATAMNLICGTVLMAELFYCFWLHRRKI